VTMARDDASESRQRQTVEPAIGPQVSSTRDNRLSPTSGSTTPKRTDDPEHLRQAVTRLEGENRRLRKRCEDAELEINHLERSLKNTENTLSFRLGYALIHSTKSLDALRSLPAALLELSQDSRRRRGAQSPTSFALAVLRSSVHTLDPRSWRRAQGASEGQAGNDDKP
jgi:hypothetical protein